MAKRFLFCMLFSLIVALSLTDKATADPPSGDVTISANTLWTEGTYQLSSLTVDNSATLTIAGGSTVNVTGTITVKGNSTILVQGKNTSAKIDGTWQGVGVTINAVNVAVDTGSKITADGQGYVTSCGPGGAAVNYYTTGGSYGGKGGGANSGPTYGSSFAPTDLGSAGGAYGPAWSAGGGAIRMIVSGTLTNNGVISANGTQDLANGYYTGGGSGGSIYATVGTLAGSGIFTANGTGGNSQFASPDGGGGGRVAIYYTASSGFNPNTVTANAGNTGATAGSVYLLENNKNLYMSGEINYPSAVTLSYENLAISNGALFTLAGGSTVTVSNTLSVVGNSTFLLQGKNTSAQVDGQWAGVGVTINAANVTVDAGSKITADGQGYVTSSGPGGTADWQSGASYGGKGEGLSGPTYGSTFAPTDLGSGGGPYGAGWSAGGGAIRLIVSGTLTNNGAISANGTQNPLRGGDASGGASGGSIYATVGTLAGGGSFSANGVIFGSLYTANAGGGGGRVAIYYTANTGFDLTKVTANPEKGGTAGSVYTYASGPGNGALTVSSGNLVLPDDYVLNLATLTVNNGASLAIGNNAVITVDSITMSGASNFRIGGGSTVTAGNIQISGTSTMTLQGKNTTAKVDGQWAGVGVTINAANVSVDIGSKITADGQGYITGSGPGSAAVDDYLSGGSYGGKGAGSSGPTYGSANAPTDLGSAGGGYGTGWSAGGGAMRLIVSGTLTNNGAITANGTQGPTGLSGGASGGSIYATVGTLAGGGSFSADGSIYGSFYTADAGGGGGRVAIYYTANNGFDLNTVTANPEKGGTAGTVVISGTLEYVWLKPAVETLHDTVRLEWTAYSANVQMTVDIIASSNGRVFTIGSRLPRISGMDWDSTTVPDGTYELRLIFRDGAGLVMGEASRTVLINNSTVWHSGTVAMDQTWTADKVHVIEGTLIIPSGVHVTINPGAVVKVVKGARIIVDGILNALGDNGVPIVFTSLADDSVGGDTNLDGVQTKAVPGDWLGISIQGSGQFNQNSHTDVRYILIIQGGTLVADHTVPGLQLLHVTDNITVPNGVTLTIMPGAIIKFDPNKGINVQTGGRLIAGGTVSLPIYFTSIKDDTIGGDTNSDGNATTPAIGDWSYISVDGSASFDHATISYGTGNLGMINVAGTLTVSNSRVMNATYDGITSVGGTATITNSILTGTDRAINEHGGTVNVFNCTIDNNRVGIWGTGYNLTVVNSIVTNSASAGFVTSSGNPHVSYSDIWNPQATNGNGGYSGSGNISVDPKYVNLQQLDYRLNYGSPAIDAADGTAAPATDFMGAPRYDDPRTANTGIAATTSAYADMGALEFAESAASNTDLIVNGVAGPASALVGSPVQLSWTITNIGSGDAVGPWHDAIYLVQDPDGNKVEILAGETLVGQIAILGPGQSLTATATIRVPGSVIGNHRWQIRTNNRGEVFEGTNSANNSGVSAGIVAIDLPELTVNGSALSSQFTAVGESAWYKVKPESGKDIDVMLALGGSTGDIQLYIGQGYIPDPQHFNVKQNQWNTSNPAAHISSASTQTYYVTAYAGSLSATPASFTISAQSLNFSVTAIEPGSASNFGNTTFEITGAQLSDDALYGLVAPDGTIYRPLSVFTKDSSDVFVTFDLTGLAAGSYDMQVTEKGTTVTDDNAVNVTPGITFTLGLHYEFGLIVPQAVRAGGKGTVTVTYKNISNTDAIAPLMWLDAVRYVTLEEIWKCRGRCPFTVASSTGMMLGINREGLAGVLPPGASGSISFIMKPTVTSGEIRFGLHSIRDESAAMNWDGMRSSMKPAFVDANAWSAVFDNAISSMGSSAGQYNAALAANATYLSGLGIYENNISALFTFELMKAGLATIIPRYTLGAFGRGASHAFDIWGNVEDGNIVLHYPVGKTRMLVPDPDTPNRFIGNTGDYGTLSVDGADQSWMLTEKNGTALYFKVDPNNANHHVIDYMEDLNGNRVTVHYTGSHVTSVTSSNGDTQQYSYNSQGRITQSTDAVGKITTYTYDTSGDHLLTVTNAAGTTSFAYITGQGAAQEHAVQSVTYPDGTHRYFEYDPKGRLTKQSRDGGAEMITYAYNATGEVTVTDALGNRARILPTNFGQIGQVSDPRGAITRFSYDQMQNLVGIAAPQGTTSSFNYDSLGNLTTSFDPLGNQQNFGYGSYGALTSLTDSLSNMLKYSYDSRYNNTAITYPNGSAEQGVYDAHGNLVQGTNRRGRSVTLTYDAHDLLTRKLYPSGSHVDYAYDSHRNLQSLTDSSGTTSFTFDSADRLTGITYPNGRFVHYAYDSGGRRSSMTDQTGYAVNYTYDSAGRLSQLSDGGSQLIVAYTYDSAGRIARKTMGNGTYTTYSYDPAGKLLQLVNHAANNAVNSSYAYTYDLLGRKTGMTAPDGVYSYGYDATGQLTSITLPGGGSVQYTYDAAGNRVSTVASGVTTNYSTNGLNEYTSAGGTAFAYDNDGNLVSKSGAGGTWNYVYDDENRLVGMTGSGNTWTYEYDSLGNRVAQIKNGQRTEYLIDPTGLGNVIAEFDGSGTLLAHYTYGFDLTSAVPSGGTASYYHFDGSGNTAQITGAAGNVLNSYSFLPFGEKVSSSETVSNPFTYVGQYGVRDEGNSLYFMRNRWYDPGLGRFTQPDPLGIGGGDANLYRYVHNRPIGLIDPWGLKYTADDGFEHTSWVTAAEGTFQSVGEEAIKLGTKGADKYVFTKDLIIITEQEHLLSPYKSVGKAMNAFGVGTSVAQLAWTVNKFRKGEAIGWEILHDVGGVGNSALAYICPLASLSITLLDLASQRPLVAYYNYSYDKAANDPNNFGPRYWELKDKLPVKVLNSADPNLKITVGYGDRGFVTGDTPLVYTIDFENMSSATAPAQKVVVTDRLSADLDWSTLQLLAVGFNNTNINIPGGLQTYTGQTNVPTDPNPVKITANLNSATGIITWTMESVDPVTGDVPEDPYAGFLPPNDATHRGDGYVTFTVNPRSGLADGTTITNQASIVFDVNAAILTNTVTNTLDLVNPTSYVVPIPATTTTPAFTVTWAGTDESGSGIAAYDVYVSTDDGPLTAWLTGTTETSAIFYGVNGHKYGFYSTATDNAGNRQNAPATAQTVTSVNFRGDVNDDNKVDLMDAILALQVMSRISPAQTVYKKADVNGDKRINLMDAIYILQKITGLR